TGLLPTCSTMPVCTKVRKPCSITSSRYGPMGIEGNENDPLASVTTSRLNPVSVCVIVTVAPGSTPPLWSRTVPEICAVPCAEAPTAPNTIRRPHTIELNTRVIGLLSRAGTSRGAAQAHATGALRRCRRRRSQVDEGEQRLAKGAPLQGCMRERAPKTPRVYQRGGAVNALGSTDCRPGAAQSKFPDRLPVDFWNAAAAR